jgi:Condensation domain
MAEATGDRSSAVLLGEGHADRDELMPVERVLVGFAAQDSGTAEMTWGQLDVWRVMVSLNSWLPLGGTTQVAPGTRVADVADDLRYLMTRCPSMRTRLRFDAGAGARPVQVLFGSGQITLELFEAGDAEPEQTAATVEAQYRNAEFHLADHWPVRMALVLSDGVPTHMVALVCHLALDITGARIMLDEVARRPTDPPAGLQPLAQARWQCSSAGIRQNEGSLRYWETVIRSVPARRVRGSATAQRPVRWCAEFVSAALRSGVQAIAERTGANSSAVLVAVYATALARITGVNPVVVRPLVSNRFRPGLADVVCAVVQGGIFALDVADATVDEVVRRAGRATMNAYKYAYYDPDRLEEMITRVSQELAPEFEIRCFFNDRRGPEQVTAADGSATPATTATIAATETRTTPIAPVEAHEPSTFQWTEKTDTDLDENMFVHVDETPAAIVLTIGAHTGYFSPDEIEALARGMEQVAVAAAADPAQDTRVPMAA